MIWPSSRLFSSFLDRCLCVVLALVCMQAPLYITQYITTLSGALSEAKLFHSELEARAAELQLPLHVYIAKHVESTEPVFQKTGATLESFLKRYQKHQTAYVSLSESSGWQQPWQLAYYYDAQIGRAIHFTPGLPLSLQGLVYGVSGIALGMLTASVLRRLLHMTKRLVPLFGHR